MNTQREKSVHEEKRSFDFAQDDRMIALSLQMSDEPYFSDVKMRFSDVKMRFNGVKVRFSRANVRFFDANVRFFDANVRLFDANVRFLRQKSEVLRSISSRGTFCFPTRNRVFCRMKHFVSLWETLCSNAVEHFVPTAQNTLFRYG